jgi:hypothetical protein
MCVTCGMYFPPLSIPFELELVWVPHSLTHPYPHRYIYNITWMLSVSQDKLCIVLSSFELASAQSLIWIYKYVAHISASLPFPIDLGTRSAV